MIARLNGHYQNEFLIWIMFFLLIPFGCDQPNPESSGRPSDERSVNSSAFTSVKERSNSRSITPDPNVMRDSDWFEDVTERTDITFRYRNGRESGHYFMIESLGGGVAMIDYDQDGDLDLFFTGGGDFEGSPVQIQGHPSALYRNDGNWDFVDVTDDSGLASPGGYSHGCAVADYDQDGDSDLFVCCYGRSRLYRNNGAGRFIDVTEESGLVVDGWSTAAAWADVDRDGWPDLYVVRYLDWSPAKDQVCHNALDVRDICGPGKYSGLTDRFFRNRGDGTFEDISTRFGLNKVGNGLGVVATDLNQDGWIDFYIANDESENHLYLGGPDLKYQEVGQLAGVAMNEFGMHDGSMGVDAGDYNDDGYPDLWTTNFEREDNALYRNLGDGLFTQSTVRAALAGHSRTLVGFGTALADFDSDGRLEIFVANGHVFYHGGQSGYRQHSQLFRTSDGNRFENISSQGGTYFRQKNAARGAAVGDLDNDGALDIVVVHQNDPVVLLRNRLPTPNFLRLKLIGTTGASEAVGAVVKMRFGQRHLRRWIRSGAGYFSHSDQRVLLPVDGDTPVDVTVIWPNGARELFSVRPSRQTRKLVEGQGKPDDSK